MLCESYPTAAIASDRTGTISMSRSFPKWLLFGNANHKGSERGVFHGSLEA
jgi:hypothetical protein